MSKQIGRFFCQERTSKPKGTHSVSIVKKKNKKEQNSDDGDDEK